MTDTKPGISRRTLAKGAAWSVPAAAVVAAAPAHAASCVYKLVLSPATCKVAGGAFNYKLVFEVVGSSPGCTNPCTATITRVWQNTGQGETYWTGSAQTGQVITVCGAPNMSSKLRVDAVIPCIPQPASGYYLVDTPNFNSANNQCATAPNCPAIAGSVQPAEASAKSPQSTGAKGAPEADATTKPDPDTSSTSDTAASSTDTAASSTDTTASSTDTTASSTDTTASSTDTTASTSVSAPASTDTATSTDSSTDA